MKNNPEKRLICCLAIVLFLSCSFSLYGKNLTIKADEAQTRPKTESLPQTEPPQTLRSRVLKVFDVLEVYLPRLIFFVMLLALVPVIRAAYIDRKQERAPGLSSSIQKRMNRKITAGGNISGQDSSNTAYDTDGEDYFQRERRNWVSQLDEMLKNGMIDKKEYNELKKQYE